MFGIVVCRSWLGDKRAVTALAFVEQGPGGLLVSAASKIKVWDLATGAETLKFSGHAYAIGSLVPLFVSGAAHVVSAVLNHPDDLQVRVVAHSLPPRQPASFTA